MIARSVPTASQRFRMATRPIPKVLMRRTAIASATSPEPSSPPPPPPPTPPFQQSNATLNACIDFVSWLQEERDKIQQERKQRIDVAQESLRAVVQQERDTLMRLIREIREKQGRISKGGDEEGDA